MLVVCIAPWQFSRFWPVSEDYYDYLPQALFAAITAIACVLLALDARNGGQAAAKKTSIGWCLLAFAAWMAVSCFGAIYKHDALLETARVVSVVTWFFIARAVLSTVEFDRTCALIMSAIALGACAAASSYALGFLKIQAPQTLVWFTNNNLFANYCAMALPLCLGATALWRRAARTNATLLIILGLAATAWIALGLLASASKGGLLAALCGGVAFLVVMLRARGGVARNWLRARPALAISIALVLLGGGGFVGARTVLPRIRAARGAQNHSTMFRVYTWRSAADMTAARPLLGFGPASFPYAHSKFSRVGFTRTAHQSWLQIAAESGVPALLFLLGATVLALVRGWRAAKWDNGARWPVAAGACGAIVAFAVHACTDAGWGIISVALLVMICCALLDACGAAASGSTVEIDRPSNIDRTPQKEGIPASQRTAGAWLLAMLLMGGASWLGQRASMGEDLRRDARDAAARGDSTTALERARAATISDPLGVRAWSNLAQTEERAQMDAQASWQRAVAVAPWNAQTWRQFASYQIRRGADPDEALARSLEIAPNDTQTLRERAQWRLARNDARGWADWEAIARLLKQPYGLYEATPELVNFDYPHALLELATRDIQRGQRESANARVRDTLQFIAQARAYQQNDPELVLAARGAQAQAEAQQELETLEARAKGLRAKLKS